MSRRRWLSQDSKVAKALMKLDRELGFFVTGFSSGIVRPSRALKYGDELKNEMREIELSRTDTERRKRLYELRRRKLIAFEKVAGKYQIALTGVGISELFRLKVLDSDLLDDDQVCMVVFDIPEQHRKLRLQLRRFLTKAGFVWIQKSVWISPFDAAEPLAQLFRLTGTRKWVRIFLSKEI